MFQSFEARIARLEEQELKSKEQINCLNEKIGSSNSSIQKSDWCKIVDD